MQSEANSNSDCKSLTDNKELKLSKVNISKGNMYKWVTHTWSPAVGCQHQCSYCYVKAFNEQPIEFRLDKPFPLLGKGKTIFVGHLCDMFASRVYTFDIEEILQWCKSFPDNKYMFQSKNPDRFSAFTFPQGTILGTTIETNRQDVLDSISKAPPVKERAKAMNWMGQFGYTRFVTIEPIMDFDLEDMVSLIKEAQPDWVNIGADSKQHDLPEPSSTKVSVLISELASRGIKIINKENLLRVLNATY